MFLVFHFHHRHTVDVFGLKSSRTASFVERTGAKPNLGVWLCDFQAVIVSLVANARVATLRLRNICHDAVF